MRVKIFKFLSLEIIVKVAKRSDSIFVTRVHSEALPCFGNGHWKRPGSFARVCP
jgi:hypothetical protein